MQPLGVVCTNDVEEQVFFTVKNFALHEVAITFCCSACEAPLCFSMPSTYIISDIDTKFVAIETLGNEKMQVTVILIEFVDSTKLPPYVLNRNIMPKVQLHMGIILGCQTKGWITSEGLVTNCVEQETRSIVEKMRNAFAGCI
jgi:hypothetical protein